MDLPSIPRTPRTVAAGFSLRSFANRDLGRKLKLEATKNILGPEAVVGSYYSTFDVKFV
jgi:hypothetical protein